jgi:hypothetical protein
MSQNEIEFAADGTWRVELLPHAAGGPVEFEIIHVFFSYNLVFVYAIKFSPRTMVTLSLYLHGLETCGFAADKATWNLLCKRYQIIFLPDFI